MYYVEANSSLKVASGGGTPGELIIPVFFLFSKFNFSVYFEDPRSSAFPSESKRRYHQDQCRTFISIRLVCKNQVIRLPFGSFPFIFRQTVFEHFLKNQQVPSTSVSSRSHIITGVTIAEDCNSQGLLKFGYHIVIFTDAKKIIKN